MSFINNILAISSFFFIIPINVTFLKKKRGDCFLLTNVFIYSFLHHLTETNEVGHNLNGNREILYFNKYSFLFRYLDIFFSHFLFGYILYVYGVSYVFNFIINNKIIFILFLISFICDFVINNQPWLYLFLHLIWHLGISFILLKYYNSKY